jgi:VanZ family protein
VIDKTPSVIQKALHVILYGMLTALWLWTLEGLSDRPAARLGSAFVLSVAFGAFVEWYQTSIPGRFGTLIDVLLNALGAAIVIFVFGFLL